jgi:putative membrane protein
VGAILPGVSGGVLSVAFGVYEPMMELLTTPVPAVKKHYRMFIPFGIGWIVGFLLLAKGVEVLFNACAPVALMLFFGLICGTLPELFKVSEQSDAKKSWTPFVVSLSLAFLFFHLLESASGITIPPSFFAFMFCGFLWGLSTIVPGLSSSSILICFGLYEPMTEGIAALDPRVLLPMLLGIAVTALSLARLVNMLYKKHYAITSRVVLGFVVASSIKIVPQKFDSIPILAISLICFVLGFIVARGMDIAQKKQQNSSLEKGI